MNIKDVMFVSYSEHFNVLSDDNNRKVMVFDDSDLTLAEDKSKGKVYILVPLLSYHKINTYADRLEIDGNVVLSNNFWRDCGCQVIEYQGDFYDEKIKAICDDVVGRYQE